MNPLLIFNQEELQAMVAIDDGGRLNRALGRLNRAGFRLLTIAPRPERWRPTRGQMDDALSTQQTLHEGLEKTGAVIDGTYYYNTGWFSQQRYKEDMYAEISRRTQLPNDQLLLVSGFSRELESAREAGLEVMPLPAWEGDEPDPSQLELWVEALAHISQRSAD